MTNGSPPTRPDDPLRLGPPTVTDAEKPLRRQVAMAYRTVREAGRSHHDALDAAEAVYFKAHPEAMADRLAASARVNELITSAINVNPLWFWQILGARYCGPVTGDLDIYRTAGILVREYDPEQAPLMAAKRADALLSLGDIDGQRV
jgi:hypothetical protein